MSWMGEGAWWGWPVATCPATQKKPYQKQLVVGPINTSLPDTRYSLEGQYSRGIELSSCHMSRFSSSFYLFCEKPTLCYRTTSPTNWMTLQP